MSMAMASSGDAGKFRELMLQLVQSHSDEEAEKCLSSREESHMARMEAAWNWKGVCLFEARERERKKEREIEIEIDFLSAGSFAEWHSSWAAEDGWDQG